MRRAHPVAEAAGVSDPGATFVGQRDRPDRPSTATPRRTASHAASSKAPC